MSQSKKAAKSIAILIFFSLASKLLGFIRESLIAAKFGSGAQTDTFFIALSAITLFTTMIIKSINSTMIPVLSEIEEKEGKQGKINHTNNLLNIIFLISFILIVLAWILAPIIIKIIATGFKGNQFKLAVLMMRVGLPAIFFASVQGVFRGYLQSELMFTESAISELPFNFVYILFLTLLASKFDIRALMVVSVLAVAARVITQIPGVTKTGFRYKLVLDFKDQYVKRIVYLIPPVLVSATISDLNNIIDKSMASNLVVGSISSLQYAKRIESLITGTFILAINTVIYPMLSKEANKDNHDGLKKTIIYGINIIMLITIPATIGIIVLANPIVKVAFERGAFDSIATNMTAGALIFYSIGLTAASITSMINSAYYSLQDTKTPMTNSFMTLGANIVLNIIFIRFMGHKGLALATSISTIVTLIYLLYKLREKIGSFGLTRAIKCGAKSLAASVTMGVTIYFINSLFVKYIGNSTMEELVALLISIGVGILIYFALIYLFKIEELNWITNIIKNKLKSSKSR